jgi:glycine dehydrogenase subunit 1
LENGGVLPMNPGRRDIEMDASRRTLVHPYIPNLVPDEKQEMLDFVGAASTDELFTVIPEALRYRERLSVPEPLLSEYDLRRDMELMLARNETCSEFLSFLGGGCWQHYVPAVCEEIGSRGEFLTGYHDGARSMLGSYQAQFEFQSMLGELVGMEMVSTTTYDWGAAAVSSLLMAHRLTGRREVLVPATTSPTRLRQIRTSAGNLLDIKTIPYDHATGALDLEALHAAVSSQTAAVYLEMPSYLGFLEYAAAEIADVAHARGAMFVVGVDPSSLGVLATPREYGADIVCGEIQPLGIHMFAGGGLAGFIATPHEERFISACPTLLVSILPTVRSDEFAFDWVNFEHSSYSLREESEDFAGTTQTIWAIVAAVYLALMGPEGMLELGQTIMERSTYAMKQLSKIPGVLAPALSGTHFKEFVVNFDGTGKTVADINAALHERRIFGGVDLSRSFPELGNSALYCVTEVHRMDDIDRLVAAVAAVVR